MRNLKGGYKIKYRGILSSFLDIGGSPRQEKACEKPAKGGFRNCVSPEIGGCFQREETRRNNPLLLGFTIVLYTCNCPLW